MDEARIDAAKRVRDAATDAAKARAEAKLKASGGDTIHHPNKDEDFFADKDVPTSFTKGLEHNPKTGLVARVADFNALRRAIDDGCIVPFTTNVPSSSVAAPRQWEAPTAGFVFDLQGPDAQAVTMRPAPAISGGPTDGSFKELALEMAEVYELALLRDEPFSSFSFIWSDAKDRRRGQSDDRAAQQRRSSVSGQAVIRRRRRRY